MSRVMNGEEECQLNDHHPEDEIFLSEDYCWFLPDKSYLIRKLYKTHLIYYLLCLTFRRYLSLPQRVY